MAQPLVALQIEEGANHDLLRLLEEERLDFAFVRSEVDRYPLVTRTTLAKEPMVVAIPGKHPLAQGAPDPLRLADLAAVDWVMYRQSNGAGIYDTLIEACAARGFRPRTVGTTERVISAINMVATGFGITVVPRAAEAFRLPNVVYRALADDDDVTVSAQRRLPSACDQRSEAAVSQRVRQEFRRRPVRRGGRSREPLPAACRCASSIAARRTKTLARSGSAAMARSSRKFSCRAASSRDSRRFLFSMLWRCTKSVAIVRRCLS